MVVRTQSERLARLRRGVMELYISDHPRDCLTCSANGNCELQDAAGEVGLREVRYGYDGENHLDDAKDESNPYFAYDPAKCIVCSRCVRACEEVQGTFALTVEGRGFDSRIRPGPDRFPQFRMRLLRRLRAGLPDRDSDREKRRRARPAGTFDRHHLRLLRRRLLLQGGNARRRAHPHGPLQAGTGQ